MIVINFLEKLDTLMNINGLNKSSLSKMSGIPYTTIDGWYKKGYDGLKLTTLRKLTDFFNVSLDYWVDDNNEVNNTGKVREEIAKNLLFYRKNTKHTQRELAEYLGVNSSAVSNWEKGLNSIDIDTLHKVCVFLGVSVNDMFGIFANVDDISYNIEKTETAQLIKYFNKLNKLGREKALRDIEDLTEIPKYTEIIQKEYKNA